MIRSQTSLYLAKFTVQAASQPRARVVQVPHADLDTACLQAILSALEAENQTAAGEIHLLGVERIHDVLEWVDDQSRETATPRVTPSKASRQTAAVAK